MVLWKPLSIRPGLKVGNEFIATREAANAGSSIALYYTPQRGWYGWASTGEFDLPPMERLYPLLSQSGYVAQVPASQILKMADAIRLDAPDEISIDPSVTTPDVPAVNESVDESSNERGGSVDTTGVSASPVSGRSKKGGRKRR